MRILIADELSDDAINALRELGHSVQVEASAAAADLPALLPRQDILIVRSTTVSAAAIAAGASLQLIIRAGSGVNNIDIDAASVRGILVANCPGKNATAVAELVLGLLLALDRHIVDATNDLRSGVWNKPRYSRGRGLNGRTLGLIGFGHTARAVSNVAGALGMQTIAWSRSLTPQQAALQGVGYAATPLQVAQNADAISVHLAAAPETHHLIDAAFFAAMREGAYFVNTSRGTVVDTQALIDAIQERGLKAALDVYEPQPTANDNEFLDTDLANLIIGTHHIGASTEQSYAAIGQEVVRIVNAFSKNGQPLNALNLPQVTARQARSANGNSATSQPPALQPSSAAQTVRDRKFGS